MNAPIFSRILNAGRPVLSNLVRAPRVIRPPFVLPSGILQVGRPAIFVRELCYGCCFGSYRIGSYRIAFESLKVTTSLALEVIALVWYWSALLWHFAIGSHRIAFGSSEVIALLRTLLSDVIVLLLTVSDSTFGSFRKFSTCFGRGLNVRTAKRLWPQRFPPRS